MVSVFMRILGGMVNISYISESWSDSPTFSKPKSRQNFLPSLHFLRTFRHLCVPVRPESIRAVVKVGLE